MEVEFALLADAAAGPPDGKLYVLGGGINEIKAPQFPARHAFMALVVKVGVHPAECGRGHSLAVQLWDPDGKTVGVPLEQLFTPPRNPDHPTRRTFFNFVMNIAGATFERPGDYGFQILLDGTFAKSVPLYVIQI